MNAGMKRNGTIWKIKKKCDFNCLWAGLSFRQNVQMFIQTHSHSRTHRNSHDNVYAFRNVHVLTHASSIASFMLPLLIMNPVVCILA